MLDVKRLRVLREVASAGSFSAAADSLYLTQSAVSQSIAALEREAGTTLIQRGRNGVRLTDAGDALVSHADAVLARLEQAEEELAAIAGLRAGRLRVASFPTASATILTRAVSDFRKRHPDVTFKVAEQEPEDSIPALKRGELDLALSFDYEPGPEQDDRDLERHLLLRERMHVALPRGHPAAARKTVRLADLAEDGWLCGVCESLCRDVVIGTCKEAGFEPRIAFESDDYQVLQGMVAAGIGVTLLPDLALVGRHRDLEIRPASPSAPVRRVWAVAPATGYRAPATDAMLDALRRAAERYATQSAQL